MVTSRRGACRDLGLRCRTLLALPLLAALAAALDAGHFALDLRRALRLRRRVGLFRTLTELLQFAARQACELLSGPGFADGADRELDLPVGLRHELLRLPSLRAA